MSINIPIRWGMASSVASAPRSPILSRQRNVLERKPDRRLDEVARRAIAKPPFARLAAQVKKMIAQDGPARRRRFQNVMSAGQALLAVRRFQRHFVVDHPRLIGVQ